MAEVCAFREAVLTDRRFASATHNVFAYRFLAAAPARAGADSGGGGPATPLIAHHDCDDDGETAAGTRLAEMLRLMGAEGVAMVVSRWFGGVKLGPDRFKLICGVARALLEAQGFGRPLSGVTTSGGRKRTER
jgi:putative IMPACT (imprinted ancient) family translation regulator